MFLEAIDRILKDHCTPAVVRTIEAGGSPVDLWQAVAHAGFLELMVPEADGGAELALPELFPIVCHLGYHAVPLPLAETIAARVLLRGRAVPDGMVTFADHLQRGTDGSLCCLYTPYGSSADTVVVRDGEDALLLPIAAARREPVGVRGSQVATLTWASDRDAVCVDGRGENLAAFAAALYAALISGAMARAFELTLQYCNDRHQFGRSLGKFQAVQHQLSVMAEHVAASSIAAEAAFHGIGPVPGLLPAAIAKSRSSEAAVLIASTSHALHGAIGVTEEYDVQIFTRRLHEWRMAHGSEAFWNALVGRQVLRGTASVAEFVQSL